MNVYDGRVYLQSKVKLFASMANNVVYVMFKILITMLTNGIYVGNIVIVLEQFVREKREIPMYLRPDLKMPLGLSNVSTIECTAHEFIKHHGIHFTR